MSNRGNDPAYPVENIRAHESRPGMTLREHYAGLAMQGLLARRDVGDDGDKALISALADGYALSLIAQLSKEPT